MSRQCCKTCRWAKFERTSTGRVKRNKFGDCTADFVMPKFPAFIITPTIQRVHIWPEKGRDCPLYEEIDDKANTRAEVTVETIGE